jgi:hypothetical protein
MEEDAASRDVAKLTGVEVSGTAFGEADLDWQVNFITPCFSSLSHFRLSPLRCNSVAVGRLISPGLILFTLSYLQGPMDLEPL